MTAAREAIYLPLLFLTVALAGGVRMPPAAVSFAPPPLFSLVLAMLVLALLVRSGALAPQRLMSGSRPALANVNGLALLLVLFAATAQAFNLATPSSGLPLLLFDTFLAVLLVNTLVAAPDRLRVLRSLMVIFGAAFVLKFVVLAALSDPAGGRLNRVLQLLFEGITLGSLTQEPLRPAAGYLAFVTFVLYLIGLAMLPSYEDRKPTRRLRASENAQRTLLSGAEGEGRDADHASLPNAAGDDHRTKTANLRGGSESQRTR